MPLSYEQRCAAIDARIREEAGWVGRAWVGINFAEPETEDEERALAMVQKRFPKAVTVHVYSLVEWTAELIREREER